ncbi:hypothetical protein JQX13_15110 [Archangium violaceum]|uniref:hypothetical protein n=1 Tax=Archangium violaceum TaxID=83451 RepID=UPI00193AF61E|nr:hypothetical protein [Archangium violaceum]QRK11283.1 hypothetical protein JQX13_15110 [Archangium violaceum]
MNGFFLVKVDGTVWDGFRLVSSDSDYVVSGMNRERAEITVSLCASSSSTNLSTGFYFVNGDFFCFQANYQASRTRPSGLPRRAASEPHRRHPGQPDAGESVSSDVAKCRTVPGPRRPSTRNVLRLREERQ